MNANERKSLIRGASIQIAASLAPHHAAVTFEELAFQAVRAAVHVVAELEKVEGMGEVIGALDKLKASVEAEATGAEPQPDGHP